MQGLCFTFVFIIRSCLFLAAVTCGQLLRKSLPFGSLVCYVSLRFVTFPYCISGQVWYLMVSIPSLCLLLYFYNQACRLSHNRHAVPLSFITFDDFLELIRKRKLSNGF